MATGTNKPVGSNDPRDLLANATNLDDAVNGDSKTFVDRFGRTRVSMKGVEEAVPDAISARDAAEAAASAAAGAANLKPDTATGLAETTNGEFFSTPSNNPGEAAIIWQNVGGAAVDTGKRVADASMVVNALQAEQSVGNDLNIEFLIVDAVGRLLFGLTAAGEIVSPTIKEIEHRLAVLEAGTAVGASSAMHLIVFYGQSNARGEVDYSQNWRIPMAWNSYPPGYSGPLDGPHQITMERTGPSLTLNSSQTAFVPFNGLAFGMVGEGLAHGMLDSIAAVYPEHQMATFCHAVGGVAIEYLDKPTSAEIVAGMASGIPIGPTSAERLMLDAGLGMDAIGNYSYESCATPYYKGMWTIFRSKLLAAERGQLLVLSAMAWIHGEANAYDTAYDAKLAELYADYDQDARLITGQSKRLCMLIEESNYSSELEIPGQAGYDTWVSSGYVDTSAYTPASSRINDSTILNAEQLQALDDGHAASPYRYIHIVAPRYPLTSRIHMDPYIGRAHGEQFGKVYRRVVIENVGWNEFRPTSWWIDGAHVFVRMAAPRLPLSFVVPPNATGHVMRSGRPYGFQHSAGPIQQGNIVLMGPDLIRITPDVVPAQGQKIGYLQDVRCGSLGDSDTTPAKFNDRGGSANILRNFALPFSIIL